MSQDDKGIEHRQSDVDIPNNPGPNILGHQPLIGSVRRSQDIPVIRDRAAEEVDELDGVDLPDDPVLPFLSTNR